MQRPAGDIVTLLDITPRDYQDNVLFPLGSEKTWWLPDSERRVRPFTVSLQQFPFRGPTGFGQRFTFDLKSVNCGDLLLSTVLEIDLRHWLDDTSILRFESGQYSYPQGAQPWAWANSLGTVILERAELEVNDQTIETIDGDFLNTISLLFLDQNNQFGYGVDGLGRYPFTQLATTPSTRPFPTPSGKLLIPLPFFYQRIRLQEAFPLLACKEGSVRIHITLRPFEECIRKLSGQRSSTSETPLNQSLTVTNNIGPIKIEQQIQTGANPPSFNSIQLITYAANTDGKMRQKILRDPFEILHRGVQTFFFDEPLKYQVNKTSSDIIQIQLPLEVNHPMEEIIWFVRLKDVRNNNEWTNYSSTLQTTYDSIYNPRQPLLHGASIQLNGIELIKAEEEWFRQHISLLHKGGNSAYENYIYGYSFAKNPGEHQPSNTANASRLQSVRLTLDVKAPTGFLWEVKVFVLQLQWLRFQNGICNKLFMD